jgi:fatty acid desaturase
VGVFAVAFANRLRAFGGPKVVLSLLLANQLHAITVLQHDCGHGSAYKSSIANLWVGRFLAWFIFMPYTTFTVIHRRHHVYLGDPKKDPDEWFYAGGRLWLLREVTFVPYFTLRSLVDFGRDVRGGLELVD